jgi:peptide/nickel transport system substrate-binding protein
MDPGTMSAVTAAALQGVIGSEAVDDYTLRINMFVPNYYLLDSMTVAPYFQPLSRAAVEEWGDEYGRHPLGVGPFKFVEWATGEKIVLERNPDFTWGPPFTRGGPPYIERIEFRIIPEYATAVAGLEAGEIDYAGIQPKDVQRIQDTGRFDTLESIVSGSAMMIYMNVSKPPFDDIRVRQAFNYGIDRDVLIKVAAEGNAIPAWGPITPNIVGYWPGVEYVGYNYDLEKAKALMAEAGYTPGEDGFLEKDGQPLELTMETFAGVTEQVKLLEILQQQFKELGVKTEILQQEWAVMSTRLMNGEHDMAVFYTTWRDSSLLFGLYHSNMIGFFNYFHASDPVLDQILLDMRFASNTDVNREKAAEAQRYIVEQAYGAPMYAAKSFAVLNNRVKDAVFSDYTGLSLFDAYIETE